MGIIQAQYQQDEEDSYSLENRAHSLCEHPHLTKRDVMDVGLNLGSNGRASSQACCIVKDQLLTQATNVVSQLQELCAASAEALGNKKNKYVIDPDNTMLPILSGAKTVGDLERVWRLLIQRVSRAQDKLDKNFKTYKSEDVPPSSPATTDPRIYEDFRPGTDTDKVMTRLYSQILSMSRLLTTDKQTHFEQGRNLSSAITSPIDLKTAFPDRKMEAVSLQVYYNDDGAKIRT